jgi:two-component system, sporulation sensor kinase E
LLPFGPEGGKLREKSFLGLNYESQIRISLVILIIFLILLNFGTEYLLHQTKLVLKDRIHQHLSTVALSAGLIWENSSKADLKRNLWELSFGSGVRRISFLSSDGELLISSQEIKSTEDQHLFWGVKPELVESLRAKPRKQNTSRFFSDFYKDNLGKSYLSCYSPLEGQNPRSSNWIMVEEEVSGYAVIEGMSKLNVWGRAIGVLIAGLVTIVLIRNLLRPYRTMIKRAKTEELFPATDQHATQGDLDAAVGIFEQVISELKKKEKTLQELYQQTDRKAKNLASYNEYILKSMISGMIICDQRGKITRINHPALMLLDMSEKQVLGKIYAVVFEEENPIRLAIEAAFTGQKAHSIPEVSLSRREKEDIHLALSSSTVEDEEGRMLGAVVLMTDLTEVKRLEQEISLKDKLATLGEMSSGLAHELRNSMGAILGFVKLLKKEREISPERTVDAIFNEAMSMESILQRFLAFAKPYQLKIDKVDLERIIEECHSALKETLREKRIKFALHQKPDVFPIWGDPLLLKQAFQNLMQNSVDAMPDGGKLTVDLRQVSPSSKDKTISVAFTDTGCGIPKEIHDRIFNPFFTSKEKGTGLGLSLVKKTISLHNGKIEVESEPDKETTFTVFLPMKPSLKIAQIKSMKSQDTEAAVFNTSAG